MLDVTAYICMRRVHVPNSRGVQIHTVYMRVDTWIIIIQNYIWMEPYILVWEPLWTLVGAYTPHLHQVTMILQ